ncbi:MAG: hypothetical protein PHR20_07075 [Bacteroidales bacterium]|nr:hypothetical protein [Bacteroidales bacterium]
MKKHSTIILLIIIALTFCGCKKDKIYYEQSHHFENATWQRFDHLTFDVPIEKTNKKFDLVLEIIYDKNIPFDILPVHVIITNDEGEERIREHKFRLKTQDGFRGEELESGLMLFSHVIRSNFSVTSPQTLHVDLECFYPKFEIPCIYNVKIKLVNTADVTQKEKE